LESKAYTVRWDLADYKANEVREENPDLGANKVSAEKWVCKVYQDLSGLKEIKVSVDYRVKQELVYSH